MVCLHCGATTSNGLALCELCQYAATKHFEVLPIYFRNLARWRPGRAGSRPVPGSRVLYDGEKRNEDTTGDRIGDRLDPALTSLTTWTRAFVDDRGGFTERPFTFAQAAMMGDLPESMADDKALVFTWLCAGLEHYLVSIATLEWAGELLRDLSYHETRLQGLINLVPGWYAGTCQRKVAEVPCGTSLYVMPGLTWVTCPGCNSTTAARDHLETILEEARAWVARPKRIAEALVALLDSEQSVPRLYTRIRQWAFVEDIQPIHHMRRDHRYDLKAQDFVLVDVPAGPARYRLGDVLDLIARNTRTSKAVKAS